MTSEIERLIDMLGCGNTTPQERIQWAHSIVDLARSEGVAEGRKEEITKGIARNAYEMGKHEGVVAGAERAKADIWKAQLYGYRVQLFPFPHDEREGLRVETEVDGMQYVMVPVASVLAPTKESEK